MSCANVCFLSHDRIPQTTLLSAVHIGRSVVRVLRRVEIAIPAAEISKETHFMSRIEPLKIFADEAAASEHHLCRE